MYIYNFIIPSVFVFFLYLNHSIFIKLNEREETGPFNTGLVSSFVRVFCLPFVVGSRSVVTTVNNRCPPPLGEPTALLIREPRIRLRGDPRGFGFLVLPMSMLSLFLFSLFPHPFFPTKTMTTTTTDPLTMDSLDVEDILIDCDDEANSVVPQTDDERAISILRQCRSMYRDSVKGIILSAKHECVKDISELYGVPPVLVFHAIERGAVHAHNSFRAPDPPNPESETKVSAPGSV